MTGILGRPLFFSPRIIYKLKSHTMVSTILIDGVVKLVKVVRYRNKPAVARVFDPSNTVVPEKVLEANRYDGDKFLDDDTCREYRLTQNGMIAI